jgi:hypothetical protein
MVKQEKNTVGEKETNRLSLSRLSAIIDERDKRYEQNLEERDKRYDIIFAGLKESLFGAVTAINRQTESAFQSAQKAIDKQELSQKQYNEDHNSLTKRMVGIEEYKSDQKSLGDKTDELKIAVNDIQVKIGVGTGKELRGVSDQARQQWSTGQIVIVLVLVVNVAVELISRFAK